ncbi:hypothetical protein [Cryptosporidium parvum Iowa II]|uniref:56 kDa transmembrane protein n=2 Tax=Cryptosporidium parvum TaxID=5807 RepID=Q5CPK8_CRYPI|nr:hypothetical protein [Cryptosporidium parvum Iowa II]QOY40881.1 Uncharacterized protein CPATCC_0011490 [Cryptosporidium parvum]WKS78112.1 putative signal peptide-containing protein [Cryptosporidium sp. 43IA8]EAK87331.1 hypothetical protein with signal peptide and cysteine rich region at the C-terminus [Cryptosporidium parvum Iowa II]WRK32600.1 Uncharacterized protein cpbgf_60010 [Cryptosporidium parvum]CAD98603.1 hypothetical predicted transmembrane protein, unknown function [Cryptosporidiu|eukprot:QOY40881.1 hypothetical protein CPATCC_002495 [Cryptosporidium parvum]
MFNYLKLFSFFTVLFNFLLLLSDQVFFNDFLNTSINPDFASKYSFIKLKSGFYRPLAGTGGRGILKTAIQLRNTVSGPSGPQQKHVPFKQGPQNPQKGPIPIGSSLGLARLLSRAIGTSSSSSTQFTGSSSGQTGGNSTGFRGIKPLSTSMPRSCYRSSAGDGKIPPCYNPNCRPLVKPVGCLSTNCPTNPSAQHFIKPGAGKRQHCKYCD